MRVNLVFGVILVYFSRVGTISTSICIISTCTWDLYIDNNNPFSLHIICATFSFWLTFSLLFRQNSSQCLPFIRPIMLFSLSTCFQIPFLFPFSSFIPLWSKAKTLVNVHGNLHLFNSPLALLCSKLPRSQWLKTTYLLPQVSVLCVRSLHTVWLGGGAAEHRALKLKSSCWSDWVLLWMLRGRTRFRDLSGCCQNSALRGL